MDQKHYDVKSNPGLGDAGLFYYYLTFAKTLDALGLDEVEDAKGVKHEWRSELTEELARRQRQRLLGQHQRPLDGRGRQPGHCLQSAGPFLLPAACGQVVLGNPT